MLCSRSDDGGSARRSTEQVTCISARVYVQALLQSTCTPTALPRRIFRPLVAGVRGRAGRTAHPARAAAARRGGARAARRVRRSARRRRLAATAPRCRAPAAAMFYGSTVWDPALIIAQARAAGRTPCVCGHALAPDTSCGHAARSPQIIALQSLFYISLGFLLLMTLGAPRHGCAAARCAAPAPRPRLRPRVRAARRAGPVAPRLSLFYFFDYSSLTVHSFMGWCAAVNGCRARASAHEHPGGRSRPPPAPAQDGHRGAPGQRGAWVRSPQRCRRGSARLPLTRRAAPRRPPCAARAT